MKLTTKGLVIKEQNLGEADKIVSVLTSDYGFIKAFAKNAKNIKRSLSTAVSLLSFSEMDIFFGKESYIINDGKSIEMFLELRKDIGKMSLAQYFCELALVICNAETKTAEHLSLILNALHLLCKSEKNPLIIKSCVEMRMLCLCGFMPDLVMCPGCGCYESEQMFFLLKNGKLVCDECKKKGSPDIDPNELSLPMDMSVATALRHTVYADSAKLFSFDLPSKKLSELNKITETYVLQITQHEFKTLSFLRQL